MKTTIKRIICCILFFAILLCCLSFLGRLVVPNTILFDLWEKYYDEPKDSIDVVFIGSSAMYRYWIPPQAYAEGNITSALLADPSQPFETIEYIMEEAAKTQNPEVYVVEVRKIIKTRSKIINNTYDPSVSEYAIGRLISGMKPSLTKLRASAALMPDRDFSFRMEWMFPILKFHDNVFDLPVKVMLKRIPKADNSLKYANQISLVKSFTLPQCSLDAGYELTQADKAAVDAVVAKAESLGAKVLFLSTPYVMDDGNYTLQTQLEEYMKQKGYAYLNTQDSVDEMGVVYETDFYNSSHFNISGAQKFTRFMLDYLLENYSFSGTHSAKTEAQWEEACVEWDKKAVELMDKWAENVEKAQETAAGE